MACTLFNTGWHARSSNTGWYARSFTRRTNTDSITVSVGILIMTSSCYHHFVIWTETSSCYHHAIIMWLYSHFTTLFQHGMACTFFKNRLACTLLSHGLGWHARPLTRRTQYHLWVGTWKTHHQAIIILWFGPRHHHAIIMWPVCVRSSWALGSSTRTSPRSSNTGWHARSLSCLNFEYSRMHFPSLSSGCEIAQSYAPQTKIL
jgi:hypothetical protein